MGQDNSDGYTAEAYVTEVRTIELRLVKFTTTREIICSGERLN